MSRSGTFTESNGTASTARFTTTATIRCEAYPADDGSPPPSPTLSSDVAVGKRWQNNMNNISNDNISNGKSLSNGHGPRAGLTSLNGASFGAAVKKTGSVEDRWKPNSTSTSRDYTSPAKQGALNGLQEPVRPSRISLAAMGSKNDNSHDFKSGAIGLGGPAPPPPPAPPMPSFGATNGSSAGFSGRSVSRSDMTNKVSLPTAAHSFGANTNSLPRGFNSKTFNHNSVPRGYTPSSVNGAAPCKVSTSSTPTLPAGSSSTLPRGFNLSVAANGGTKMSGGSTIPSAGLANALRRADSADPNPTSAKPKADPNDPQVRKLVYNMYRGLLDKKHDHSNTIISNLPQLQVDRDEGVKNRVLSMMKQQEELKSGKISTMNGPAGPPPPPPPPPFIVEGATPPVRPEPIQVARPAPRSAPVMPLIAPPAALAGAMMKDKKPFTYTPGGLDLSEIRSPRMQRRLSRNAALEGVRPSPLAQHSSTCSPTPGSQSPSVQSGLAVQVLPMPGMSMARTTPLTPPPSQPKEPVVKKNVCGPPPPPPPFTISSGDFKLSPPEVKSVPSGSKATASPPLPSYASNEPVLTTPSSPPFSSPPSNPRSPSLSLASTNSNDSGTNIPAPPPPPPQSGAARRASIVKNGFNGESTPPTPVAVAHPSLNQAYVPQSQALSKGAEASESKMNNTGTAASSNISPNSFGESDTSRSRESSSMAVEDSSTSFREESASPSVVSNIDRPEEDMEHYNSNESLLKQISALEQITAKHQSKPESSSGLRVSNGNDRINFKTPERQSFEPKVQPILRLSSASKPPSSQQQQEEETHRKEFEEQEHKKELEEQERQRQFEEHERQVQFEEQEHQRQYEEHKRQMQIEEQERQRQLEEQERRQTHLEEQDRERRLQEERKQQHEMERQREQELERQRQLELERERHQELERQRQLELDRKREQEQIERQREAERKKQQDEQERSRQLEESRQRQIDEEKRRQLEAQRLQELEHQKLREEQEWQRHQQQEEQTRLEEQERQRQQLLQQPGNQNRFKRQGSVPIQVRQASFRADTNQQHNQDDSQGSHHVRASSVSRSPNISPTSGLIKAPLPWMSAIPRRETSAPPEFVNYAQTAQSRLQQQRAQRQQSFEQGKAPQAPSPVLKEAVVVSPPVVYQHPGQNDFSRSTLPRNTKLNNGPAQRPWVAKHQQYQPQQQTSVQQPAPRPLYQQPQQPQLAGPGQRWPEVKQPNYLRQLSQESSQRTISVGGPKVRIIPITVEQDSSSDQEQLYEPSSVNIPTIRSVPIDSCYGSYQPSAPVGNTFNPASPRTPQTPPSRVPLSSSTPTSQRWTQQPSFTAPQQQQAQQQRLPMQQQPPSPSSPQQQPQKVNYNNPIALYSDSNAVEALQQMQQSLAQLNTGLQNAYPKFIQETISNSLPTRSVSSPGPGVAIAPDMNSAPMQSRSFRILQNVVDSEASGSEDELRGYLPQDSPEAYHTAQVKTFTGGAPSPRGGVGRGTNNYAPSPLAQQVPQQYTQSQNYAKYRDDAEIDSRGSSDPKASKFFRRLQTITDTLPEGAEPQGPVHIGKVKTQQQQPKLQHGGSNGGAIPSRAFRALQQHAYGGQQEEAGPGESDL